MKNIRQESVRLTQLLREDDSDTLAALVNHAKKQGFTMLYDDGVMQITQESSKPQRRKTWIFVGSDGASKAAIIQREGSKPSYALYACIVE